MRARSPASLWNARAASTSSPCAAPGRTVSRPRRSKAARGPRCGRNPSGSSSGTIDAISQHPCVSSDGLPQTRREKKSWTRDTRALAEMTNSASTVCARSRASRGADDAGTTERAGNSCGVRRELHSATVLLQPTPVRSIPWFRSARQTYSQNGLRPRRTHRVSRHAGRR